MCTPQTDAERVEWSRRYRMAIRRFLRQGKSGSLLSAARLGRRAVTLGLETLDVAVSHEQALTALASSADSPGSASHKVGEQAQVFFAETIVSIEETHCAAVRARASTDRLTRTLRRSTRESSDADGKLNRAIAARQAAEAALKKSAEHDAKLLAAAEELQRDLRQRVREDLSTQEQEREAISCELRNEVAQALLAIDLSLLAMKTSAGDKRKKLRKDIAKAQRLVGESLRREGV